MLLPAYPWVAAAAVSIFVHQGTILLAVNPLKAVPEPALEDFTGKTLDPERPHPYAIAEVCFDFIAPSFSSSPPPRSWYCKSRTNDVAAALLCFAL